MYDIFRPIGNIGTVIAASKTGKPPSKSWIKVEYYKDWTEWL